MVEPGWWSSSETRHEALVDESTLGRGSDSPLAFIGLIVGKSVRPEAVLDATIAGGLVAILGSVVAGVFNHDNDKEDQ